MVDWESKSPQVWSANIGMFRLVVHRHIDWPADTWLATCNPGLFSLRKLASKDVEEAKCQAVAMLQVICEEAIQDITSCGEQVL